jgi:hypothetical protein
VTAAVVIVASIGALFVVARLSSNQWDPSRFVWAGVGHADPAKVPAGLYVHRDTGGFDGQFFYRLALDPLTDKATAHGITLDIPTYRQQRVLYPAIVWLVTGGGHSRLLPWALILVNLAALTVVAYCAARLVVSSGRSALWGVPLALVPGGAVALTRDTSELCAAAGVLGALLLLRQRRVVPAAIVMCLAVLARETTLVIPLGIFAAEGVHLLRRRRPDWARVGAAAVATAVFAGWQLFCWRRWGTAPLLSGAGAAGSPVVGFLRTAVSDLREATPERWLDVGGMAFLAAFAAGGGWAIRRTSAPSNERWAFAAAVLIMVLLNPVQWTSHTGYLRATIELSMLGGLVLIGRRRPWADGLVLGSAGIWLAAAVVAGFIV